MGDFKFGVGFNFTHQTIPYRHQINRVVTDYEPARANRFIIHTLGTFIPDYQIRSYDLNIVGNNFSLDLFFHDFVSFTFNPNNFNHITGFLIEYVDPVGVVYNRLNVEVIEHLEFNKFGDYSDDTITINHAKFLIRVI